MTVTSSPVSIEEMQRLVGWRFPGGTYTIRHWENFLLTDVLTGPPMPADLAHPGFVFNATMAAMGISFPDFFLVCHAESDDAIRAGEYGFELHRPLRENLSYRVDGEIVSVERKRGSRIGVFDLVTFRLEMTDPDAVLVLTTSNTWVFLRTTA